MTGSAKLLGSYGIVQGSVKGYGILTQAVFRGDLGSRSGLGAEAGDPREVFTGLRGIMIVKERRRGPAPVGETTSTRGYGGVCLGGA